MINDYCTNIHPWLRKNLWEIIGPPAAYFIEPEDVVISRGVVMFYLHRSTLILDETSVTMSDDAGRVVVELETHVSREKAEALANFVKEVFLDNIRCDDGQYYN